MKQFNFTFEEVMFNEYSLFAVFQENQLLKFSFVKGLKNSFRSRVIHSALKELSLKDEEKINLCGEEPDKIFVFHKQRDLFTKMNKLAFKNCLFNISATEKIEKLLNIILSVKFVNFDNKTLVELLNENQKNNLEIVSLYEEIIENFNTKESTFTVYPFLENKQTVLYYLNKKDFQEEFCDKEKFEYDELRRAVWVSLDEDEFYLLYQELKYPYEKLFVLFSFLYGLDISKLYNFKLEDVRNLLNREIKLFGKFEHRFQNKNLDYFEEIEKNIKRHFSVNETLGSNQGKLVLKTILNRLEKHCMRLGNYSMVFRFFSLSSLKYNAILHFLLETENLKLTNEIYGLSIPMLYKLQARAFFKCNFPV